MRCWFVFCLYGVVTLPLELIRFAIQVFISQQYHLHHGRRIHRSSGPVVIVSEPILTTMIASQPRAFCMYFKGSVRQPNYSH
jgi:hypothetical protein